MAAFPETFPGLACFVQMPGELSEPTLRPFTQGEK